ncbi:LysR family transcriptional regulator [Actinomarinicola tropica]|uniref:LysR family transcriptional regulator n=1 Tax=Actinomarinicola tropica TaxID=2789776 RepID=A0A5Q2RPI2_9ACTN|nr:LysR family transcriptional regulator [Actinomarinicola tropica]QGG96862.1 LysR family transcriptional regulator [Actinomarinicola tropica]
MDSPPVPLPNLTVQQLEYLVAVGRTGTWAEAAATVGVTPSALSQGLAELERRVGVAMFERDGRRRVLTASGREVLAHAEAVVARTADLARWAAGVRAGSVGQVRIGMIDAAAVHHLPDLLRRFRQDHPDVELHLRVGPSRGLLDELVRADLDLVVCVRPPRPVEGVETTPLLDEPLRVYAPPGADTDAPPAGWGPWVSFPAGSHSRQLIARAVAAAGAPFDVVAESHQPEVLREMVAMGIGWTVLPVPQAESGLDPMRPARVRPLVHRTLVLARRTDTVAPAAVEALNAALLVRAAE